MYALSPTVTLIQLTELFFIVVLAVAYVLGAPRKALLSILAAIAAIHVAYIAAYTRIYGLSLRIYPFLDVLVQKQAGHASAIVDVAQVAAAAAAIDAAVGYARGRGRAGSNTYKPSRAETPPHGHGREH